MDRLLYAGVYTGLGLERTGLGVRIGEGMVIFCRDGERDIAWHVDRGYRRKAYHKAKDKSRVGDGNRE